MWLPLPARTVGHHATLRNERAVQTSLMHRLGFSPQVPARRVAERDEQAVTTWKEVTWDEVKEPGLEGRLRDWSEELRRR